MGDAAQPCATYRVDLRRVEGIRDPLYARRRVGGADAVVQGLEWDPPRRQLAREPLVPIQTELRREGATRFRGRRPYSATRPPEARSAIDPSPCPRAV